MFPASSLKTIALVLAALAPLQHPRWIADDTVNPTAVLEKMRETYARASNYQDTGIVEAVINMNATTTTMTQPFSIAYQEPDRIKVEWLASLPGGQQLRSVLWSDGDVARKYSEVRNEVRKEKSLKMGVAAATGVSFGAAHTVPTMLLRGLKESWLSSSSDTRYVKEEAFEGVPCFVISGRLTGADVL